MLTRRVYGMLMYFIINILPSAFLQDVTQFKPSEMAIYNSTLTASCTNDS